MRVDIHLISSSYQPSSHQLSTMKLDLHYVEPRLVQLYDTDNPLGIDSDFYMQLATELDAKVICDLGCGTGLLTRKLAIDDRQVFGIDPAYEMLAFAKQQPNADRVTWINGDASKLALHNVDLTIMTGNVAQVFLDDGAWQFTLSQISKATKPGGTLAFESRNPAAKGWERWNKAETHEVQQTPFGPLECWLDVVEVGENSRTVKFEATNIFQDTGETLIIDSTLRFRTAAETTLSLQQAGFSVERIYGDWHKKPFAPADPIMVFVAKKLLTISALEFRKFVRH